MELETHRRNVEQALALEDGRQAAECWQDSNRNDVERRLRPLWERQPHCTPWDQAQQRIRSAWSNFQSA